MPNLKKPLYSRIRTILQSARSTAGRTVNAAQVLANWLVGKEIVGEELQGKRKAQYVKSVLNKLSIRVQKEFGSGYSVGNLELFRRFYLTYPDLISDGPRRQLLNPSNEADFPIQKAMSGGTWTPGRLHTNLSWTHYRTLLCADTDEKQAFYKIESIQNSWSAWELERQINSLLYDWLALSKDKKGQEIQDSTAPSKIQCYVF